MTECFQSTTYSSRERVMKKAFNWSFKQICQSDLLQGDLWKIVLGGHVHPGHVTNVKWIFDRVLQQTMLAVRAHEEWNS